MQSPFLWKNGGHCCLSVRPSVCVSVRRQSVCPLSFILACNKDNSGTSSTTIVDGDRLKCLLYWKRKGRKRKKILWIQTVGRRCCKKGGKEITHHRFKFWARLFPFFSLLYLEWLGWQPCLRFQETNSSGLLLGWLSLCTYVRMEADCVVVSWPLCKYGSSK